MTERQAPSEGQRRKREPAKAKLALKLILQGGIDARQLSKTLREQGIPRSTYYWVADRLGARGVDPVESVWKLLREHRELEGRIRSLEQDLLIVQEAMGKPWRRLLPGERPSGGS